MDKKLIKSTNSEVHRFCFCACVVDRLIPSHSIFVKNSVMQLPSLSVLGALFRKRVLWTYFSKEISGTIYSINTM